MLVDIIPFNCSNGNMFNHIAGNLYKDLYFSMRSTGMLRAVENLIVWQILIGKQFLGGALLKFGWNLTLLSFQDQLDFVKLLYPKRLFHLMCCI